MKTKIALLATVISINACQSAKESAQDGVTSALEKLVESQTGQEIDLADVASYGDQKTDITYEFDGKSQINKEDFTGSIIALKENEKLNISFQVVNQSGHSLMGVFSNVPLDFTLPLTAKFTLNESELEGKPKATLVFMKVSETGMEATPMPYEGTMTITKLNETVAAFEIKGKGGQSSEIENPAAWKNLNGNVKMTSPVIQSMGLSKDEFLK